MHAMNQQQQKQQTVQNIINAIDVSFHTSMDENENVACDDKGEGIQMDVDENECGDGKYNVISPFKSITFQNFYNLQDDVGLMKFCTAALLNMPYTIKSSKMHPVIHALNELINQQKSSFVYSQYNYIERVPFMSNANDGDSSATQGIINEPFTSLSGVINEPIIRILKQIKKLERIKYCKAIIARNERTLKKNTLQILKGRKNTKLINNKDWRRHSKLAHSIQNIYNIFKNNKPEIFYTNKSIYLRNLNLQNGLHSDRYPFTQ